MKRLFGTNGVRGISNEDLNVDFALDLGLAIGTFFGKNKVIAIGRDTRISGEALKNVVTSALVVTGNHVIDLGILPTPALQYYVKTHKSVFAGVMITASHNPPEYNGIKVIWSDGTEAPREVEKKIEEIYFNRSFKEVPWNEIGRETKDHTAVESYIKGVISLVDLNAISEREFTVVVDPGNGAAYASSPELLTRLGARVISLNAQPNGLFPAREPEPSPENIAYLAEAVRDLGADFGVAHDGDADRAIFVDDKGRILGGEYTLALLARYAIEKTGKKTIVTPVSSSRVVEDVIKPLGGEVLYTKVGAPIVARKMMELGNKVALGGEENGGIIYPPHQYCRDGAMAIALIAELLAKSGKSLSQLFDEIPHYHIIKTKVRVKNKEDAMKIVEGKLRELNATQYITIDGIKAIFDDSWVLVRPSGTEPLIRVFIEAKNKERAEALKDAVLGFFKSL